MMKHIRGGETLTSCHLLALLFALSFLATGCGQQEAIYYPLAPGLSWEYEVSVKRMLGGGQATMTLTNLPPRQLGDREVVPQKMEAPGHSAFSFIAQDASGIFEHASQEDGEPEIKNPPNYLLKYPLQVGVSWEDAYKTEMLQEKIPVTIKSTIESVTETVTVPAGTFNNCVKVRGVGKAKKSMGLFGTAKIDVESTTWMCPGVGVVKSLQEEDGHNLLLGGGKASMQLAAMRKDGKPISGEEAGFSFANWFSGQAENTSMASTTAAGTGVGLTGIRQYLDSLFDRVFFPDGMKYTLTGLGTLGEKGSEATAVSADGAVVVGWSELSDGSKRAFRWKEGAMTDLGTLGGKGSEANAVSADGAVVVGISETSNGVSRAFRWKDGVMADLGTLGGKNSYAIAVSTDGAAVVGISETSNGISRAFRWKDGVMADLGSLGGGASYANAISADGTVVVGMSPLRDGIDHVFRWKGGVMTDLGTLGVSGNRVIAVSTDGTVVMGVSQLRDGSYRVFRWKDGAMSDLSTLGGKNSWGAAITSDGAVVVGISETSNGVSRAFQWKDGVMADLGTLGGDESEASAVSADGAVVVGWSQLRDGFSRVFRWKDGAMTGLGTGIRLSGDTDFHIAVSADGKVVVGHAPNQAENKEAFIATPPRVAGLPASTARMVYYVLLAVIALGLIIALALAVRHAVRGRRTPRPAPADARIFCSQCGSAQQPGATFCAKCGARLEK